MKIKLCFFVGAGLLLVGYLFLISSREVAPNNTEKTGVIGIGSLTIPVLIVNTPESRERGLSGRTALPQDSGMFFDMKSDGNHGIWMKEMYFPIDILWIDSSLRIITIEAFVAPDSYPKVFYPTRSARYVLEVHADFATLHGITLGDQITIKE